MSYAVQIAKAICYPVLITPPRTSSDDLLKTSDSIVGVPFGTHAEGNPIGATNQCIVEEMMRLHVAFPRLPLITQWEMRDSPLKPQLDLVIGQRWHPHIPTDKFFQELRQRLPKIRAPILVAHQDHIRRCVWVARAQGLYPRVPWLKKMPFDPTSLHAQAHGYWQFFPWERAAVGFFALTGRI